MTHESYATRLLSLLAPQLSYSVERADGHASRIEFAYHRLRTIPGLVRHRYGDTYDVLSASKPGFRHRVVLDRQDGQHACDCYDNTRWSACRHVCEVAIAITEGMVDRSETDATQEDLINQLCGEKAA